MINEKHRVNLGRFYCCGVICISILIILCSTNPAGAQELVRALTLPDLSGLAWIEQDLFLGVHDAKRTTKKFDWPRVSLVRLPKSELQGVTWQPIYPKFPGPEGRSSDLESACRIPGGKSFLVAESGQEGVEDRRIFHVVYHEGTIKFESHMVWPVSIKNVEATEVCQVGERLVFLYAERSDSLPMTKLRWATFVLKPLQLGEFKEIPYTGVEPVGKGARPIVALEVDLDGYIYIVSAYDSGRDDGPYRSVVWRIGKIFADTNGETTVKLGEAKKIATMDGLKVESITIRMQKSGVRQIFIGTDDEHYGGLIRLLPGVP